MNNCIRKAFICIYLMTTYSISLKALSYCFLDDFSKGMLTGTISRDTDGKFHVAAIYHNQEGLIVETRQTAQDDALLCQKTTYSFTKNPQTMVTQIKKSGVDSSKKHPKDIVKVKNPNEFVNNLQKNINRRK